MKTRSVSLLVFINRLVNVTAFLHRNALKSSLYVYNSVAGQIRPLDMSYVNLENYNDPHDFSQKIHSFSSHIYCQIYRAYIFYPLENVTRLYT